MNDPKKYTIGDLIHNVTFSLSSEFIFSDDPVLAEMKRKSEALDWMATEANGDTARIEITGGTSVELRIEKWTDHAATLASSFTAPNLLTAIEQAMKETK